MTPSSTNDIPAETLRRIIQQYGLSICDEPRRCEALLKDLCGAYKREIHLLVAAQAEKVPAELQRGLPLDVQRPRLIQQLQDDRGFDDALAEWAVNAWAYALGLVKLPPSQLALANQPQQRPPATAPVYLTRPMTAPINQQPMPVDDDDFEIIDDGRGAGKRRSGWVWVVVVGSIIFLAFAAGMAIMTLMNRVDNNNASVPSVGVLTHTPTGVANATPPATQGTATVVVKTTVTATVGTPTATATITPTATPQLACSQPVAQELATLYDRNTLGCASAGPNIVWAAWERFERGAMFWRSDTDLSYIFFNEGQWAPVNEHWDGKDVPSRGNPPQGLYAPERGFGYVWGIRDDLFNRLGWAKEQEKGFCALIQSFDKGFILQSSPTEFCTPDNLYNHTHDPDWTPLFFSATADGQWRNAGSVNANPPPAPPSATPDPATAAQNPQTRPAANGQFYAARANGINLDGNLNDWPDQWTPIATLVQGAENYTGPRDLSGDFQAAWSPDGLFLGVRVTDDKYRSGPDGTEMWKGDALEIHFDRLLAADYANTKVDGDDYQLGVSFGPKLKELRIYRWYPYDKEGEFNAPGAVKETERGYQVELLLPWAFFEQDGAVLNAGQTFGFNISISDNDDKSPAQQSMLSASPQRTTYDNPTEWGTLTLGG